MVIMCCVLIGEVGCVLWYLFEDDEGFMVVVVECDGWGLVYVYDCCEGCRVVVVEEEGDVFGWYVFDDFYGVVLCIGIDFCVVILSGLVGDDVFFVDIYCCFVFDLCGDDWIVVVDLLGEWFVVVLEGYVDVIKVSYEELIVDGLVVDFLVEVFV